MHSSWFRKPVYKTVNRITLILVVLAACMTIFTHMGWYAAGVLIILWLIFSALASYTISSGVYISAVCSVPVKDKLVCLTFDDGPCEATGKVLELLEDSRAKATFFIIGKKIRRFKNLIKKMVSSGHEIGNHSYSHSNLFPLMRVNKIKREIIRTQETIRKITQQEPVCFRPPFGVTNPLIARALATFNLTTIGWSIRSMDTTKRKPERIIHTVTDRIGPGDIVLLHDSSENILPVLKEVLVYCNQKHYKLVTISELLNNRV
ncbi:MAG: polysaccharide deacetylase family protein [Bacteroidales bacterium]|jgi:peptidoglycan/xylan/chitin deacetylase (PgdA/CDA1 family)